MVEAIMAVMQAFLNFLGIMANPQASKKVEDVLPEKSASEQALEQLQAEKQGKP